AMKNFLRVFVLAVCVLLPPLSVVQNQRSDDDRRPNRGYGISHDRWQGRLSTEDQGRFCPPTTSRLTCHSIRSPQTLNSATASIIMATRMATSTGETGMIIAGDNGRTACQRKTSIGSTAIYSRWLE